MYFNVLTFIFLCVYSGCVYECVCACVGMSMCMHHDIYVEVIEKPQVLFLAFHLL